ncbi:hypothetical protein ELG72_28005 (plasmid) [Rhizobium leguminosarum]|uniref:hypothetical protein n=1 Tax=Rhizobium leguminosarum TaxID=384 RepID=UPI001031DB7D|nr:hypothetical protein [Rhizobium leguminosarum]MBY5374607.1 hypothetical protein [Rhizobium leguminosarum]TBF25669.1 hypothetical protein ELG92_33075 [Rhizobium leguminosarum]TBF44622.1 hypothetical protein ELG91_32290 [Rhizobium leguminosarum]TBF45491.1 hypothetical protein ELG90_33335 [Rhizobium leguminosarum]TBF47856.1 hypothetical protein ELG87_29280 [Rhizobium leguminosarum]
MEDSNSKKQLAIAIVESATRTEADSLRDWARLLIDVKDENISAAAKARKAISLTASSRVILPAMKIISAQAKKHGWDDRTSSQRLGIAASAGAFALFPGANAGIAALGGAVGVPLWLVFGGGSMFLKVLYDELAKPPEQASGVTDKVIDAERQDYMSVGGLPLLATALLSESGNHVGPSPPVAQPFTVRLPNSRDL